MSALLAATPAETVVAAMAREIEDGAVIATGVASPLAILAIAVARATHAPRLTYLACVGALDPDIPKLHACSEDLGYLDGRSGEVSIPDLFDHARRGRIDLMFFGAAEVDAAGDLVETGALRSWVSDVLPLHEAARAHDRLEKTSQGLKSLATYGGP